MCDGPDGAALTIHDDGQGFDLSTITSDHMGLGIMRERAEAVGARLRIESQIGQGTTVAVSWLDERERAL